MKTGLLHLIILCFLFSSCYENEVYIAEDEIDTSEAQTIKQQAGQNTIVMANLLSDVIKAVSLSPELNIDSRETEAKVRNSCPTSFLISDGIYPDTFFVDFDNCDPSAVFDQRFDGGIMFVLHGALDDPTVCPLFSIKNSPTSSDFVINIDDSERSYDIDILNEVDFCLQTIDGGNLKYDFTLDGGINLNFLAPNGVIISGNGLTQLTQTVGTTCYPSGMEGCITLKENNKDDTTKPSTFIDNTYCVSAKPTIIECKFQDGSVERFCISTNPEGISYNIRCGCPQSGKLYIDSPASGNCNDILSTNSFWDYSFIQNPGVSSCENSALDPDNIVTRIPCGQSF